MIKPICPLCKIDLIKDTHVDGSFLQFFCKNCDPYYDKPNSTFRQTHLYYWADNNGNLIYLKCLTSGFSIYYYENYSGFKKTFNVHARLKNDNSLKLSNKIFSMSIDYDIEYFDWAKNIEKWEKLSIFS